MNFISFPGLGIEPFKMGKVAFSILGREVAWYGLIICVGIILAITYSYFRARTEKIKGDDIIDLSFFLVMFGIIGARLYYVIFELDSYLVTGQGFVGNLKGTLLNAIAVWEGGLAIYGAIIAGFLTILVFTKIKKIKLTKMLDVASPAVMIGQLIGRWGNFVNVEAYGAETTLPWRMGIHTSLFENAPELGIWLSETYVHPTFLYESLWNLVGFVVANVIYRKKKFDGQIFFFYIGWYGFGRMLIEGLRTDSLMLGSIRVSQLVGLLTFIAGVVFTIIMWRRANAEKALLIDGAFAAVDAETLVDEEENEAEAEAEEPAEAEEETAEAEAEAEEAAEDTEDGEDN